MTIQYRSKIKRLFDDFRATAGSTTPTLRRAVEEQTAAWAGAHAVGPEETIPEALQSYLQKVTLNAYKITENDITALKAAGYSEDEIFELTLSATLGASRARLDLGLSLLAQENGQQGDQSCA